MSVSEATQQRLPIIKQMLVQGKTAEEIAVECGVTSRTIERDKRSWRASGLFDDWIREEAMRLHYIIVNEEPVEAYRQIMRLLGRTLVRKIEARTEEKIDITKTFVVKMWKPEKVESTT